MTREEAYNLLKKYVTDEKTLLHSLETEVVMRDLAEKMGEDKEKWRVIGLLHDIDWDLTKDDIKNHTIKAREILENEGVEEEIIQAIESHTYGNKECGANPEQERKTNLEHLLAAGETITGLIFASALMQPDKKLENVKLSSLKKKFKSKNFAANCDRNIIAEAERAGLSIDEFLEICLHAMQRKAKEFGL